MKFNVTMVQEAGGTWLVECPALAGCVSWGETREEVLENIRMAIDICIMSRAERGLSLTVETPEQALENIQRGVALCLWMRQKEGLPLTVETLEVEVVLYTGWFRRPQKDEE